MDVKGAKALAERLAQEDEFLKPEPPQDAVAAFVHPETGELLVSKPELIQALREVEERLAPLYRTRRAVRTALGDHFEPTLPERRRDWTKVQEAVSRCPRCGDRLPKEDEVKIQAQAAAVLKIQLPEGVTVQARTSILGNGELTVEFVAVGDNDRDAKDKLLAAVAAIAEELTADQMWPVPEEPAPAAPPPDLSDSLE